MIAGQTCNSKIAFTIPGKAFVPPPKVNYQLPCISYFCLLRSKVDAGVVYLEPKIKIVDNSMLKYLHLPLSL